MPHNKRVWRGRIKETEREYQAVQIALDLLDNVAPDELHELAQARGWDQPATTDVYAAARNVEATYLIRMYSVFERAIGSFWRQIPANAGRKVEGDVMLYEVGDIQYMDYVTIGSAQEIRIHRNNLVHRRIDDHAQSVAIEAASQGLLAYLNGLPDNWA